MTEQKDQLLSTADNNALENVADNATNEITALRHDFQSRLLTANLRTEAIRAGMVDLDGLMLIDRSGIKLDGDDTIIEGRKLMENLKANKPWLFAGTSSSSTSVAPAAQPAKQKMALEMTDAEYAIARAAVIKYRV